MPGLFLYSDVGVLRNELWRVSQFNLVGFPQVVMIFETSSSYIHVCVDRSFPAITIILACRGRNSFVLFFQVSARVNLLSVESRDLSATLTGIHTQEVELGCIACLP